MKTISNFYNAMLELYRNSKEYEELESDERLSVFNAEIKSRNFMIDIECGSVAWINYQDNDGSIVLSLGVDLKQSLLYMIELWFSKHETNCSLLGCKISNTGEIWDCSQFFLTYKVQKLVRDFIKEINPLVLKVVDLANGGVK